MQGGSVGPREYGDGTRGIDPPAGLHGGGAHLATYLIVKAKHSRAPMDSLRCVFNLAMSSSTNERMIMNCSLLILKCL